MELMKKENSWMIILVLLPGLLGLLFAPIMFILSDWGQTTCGSSAIGFKLFRTYILICSYIVIYKIFRKESKYINDENLTSKSKGVKTWQK
jgi:ABC-type transport system involved in cytochrome bd biosynthesis fused ATPase/permease subunit